MNQTQQTKAVRNVRVDDVLWHAAQHQAETQGENVSEVIRRALEDYVNKARLAEPAVQALVDWITVRFPNVKPAAAVEAVNRAATTFKIDLSSPTRDDMESIKYYSVGYLEP